MTYSALTNWKYDKNIYHAIQSGPQRTSNDLNLTDTYTLTSSGYVYASGEQQTYVALTQPGANFGVITPGPPQSYAADLGLETTTFPSEFDIIAREALKLLFVIVLAPPTILDCFEFI